MDAQLVADVYLNALQLAATFFSLGAVFGLGISWLADRALVAAELRLEARKASAPLTVTEFC